MASSGRCLRPSIAATLAIVRRSDLVLFTIWMILDRRSLVLRGNRRTLVLSALNLVELALIAAIPIVWQTGQARPGAFALVVQLVTFRVTLDMTRTLRVVDALLVAWVLVVLTSVVAVVVNSIDLIEDRKG